MSYCAQKAFGCLKETNSGIRFRELPFVSRGDGDVEAEAVNEALMGCSSLDQDRESAPMGAEGV